jgi:hypothetical protein
VAVDPAGRIFFATAGKSYVVQAGPELKILATTDLGDGIVQNCLLGRAAFWSGNQYHGCTILGDVKLAGQNTMLRDCIVSQVLDPKQGLWKENCNIVQGVPAVDTLNCFSADPEFLDPARLDFRLGPKSPCRGKASDGGDLGVRYSPEMLEMLKLALELRARGVIKFPGRQVSPFGGAVSRAGRANRSGTATGSSGLFRCHDDDPRMFRQLDCRVERPHQAVFHDAFDGNRTPALALKVVFHR